MSDKQTQTYQQSDNFPVSPDFAHPEPGSPAAKAVARREVRGERLASAKKVGLKVGVPALISALGFGVSGVFLEDNKSKPVNQDKMVQINPEVKDSGKELQSLVDASTIAMTNDIVTLIERTGGNGYRGDMFGNKNDHKWGAPEGFMSLDAAKGKLYVSVVNLYDTKTGKPEEQHDNITDEDRANLRITWLDFTFSVNPDNAINGVTKQLEAEDFKNALKQRAFAIERDAEGKFTLKVNENAVNRDDFEGVSAQEAKKPTDVIRVLQIAGSAVDDLKEDAAQFPGSN